MNKKTTPSVWDDEPTTASADITSQATESVVAPKETKAKLSKPAAPVKEEPLFDLEGLMTDFPTARELEKFVFDQTGHVLNLKGRSNKFKYQTAMDVLNGAEPDASLIGTENPYLDRNELIPKEELREVPAPEAAILAAGPVVHKFDTRLFPHPDPDWKAQGQNCQVTFKKYSNGGLYSDLKWYGFRMPFLNRAFYSVEVSWVFLISHL